MLIKLIAPPLKPLPSHIPSSNCNATTLAQLQLNLRICSLNCINTALGTSHLGVLVCSSENSRFWFYNRCFDDMLGSSVPGNDFWINITSFKLQSGTIKVFPP